MSVILLVWSLLFVFSAAAERIVINDQPEDVLVTVLESDNSKTVLKFEVGAFEKEEMFIKGEQYFALSLGREHVLANKGEPALPQICRSIIIPDKARVDIRVVSADYVDFANTRVVPSKGGLARSVNPEDVPYTFGEVYNLDAWYPGEVTAVREPFILRDYRGAVVEVMMAQCNPVTGVLRVYSEVTVEIANAGPGEINVIENRDETAPIIPEFEEIYRSRFINYNQTIGRYSPVGESGEMLIITYDGFHASMTPFVNWKQQKGIRTTMVDISAIGNNVTSIKNYIQNFYNTHDLAWVLLVGDYEQVTSPIQTFNFSFGTRLGPSDFHYALLAGGDNYPDVLLGRFSGENTAHIETQVGRTVSYESATGGTDWFHKGTGIASTQGPGHNGEYDHQHIGYIRNDLLGFTYTLVDELYGVVSPSSISSALNSGRSIINFCGHGTSTGWYTDGIPPVFSISDVNGLSNDNMLPFIVSVACQVGDFDGQTCFAESWLRATNGSNPTGALATYMSSVDQPWVPPMDGQDEAIDLLVAQSMTTFGGICYNSACKVLDLNNNNDGIGCAKTWHIFGDPSVQLRTNIPAAMAVGHDDNIPSNATTFEVTVSGVEGALCALYENGALHGSAYTNASGIANIAITEPLPSEGTVTLTVTAFNKATYVTSLPIGYQCPISAVLPSNNALDVDTSHLVAVFFSEEMNPATFSSTTFKVIGHTTGEYDGAITYFTGPKYATFVHSEPFKEGEEISVVLTDGITTAGGAPLTGGYNWSFIVASCGSGDFGVSNEYDTEYRPYDIVLADLDNDGDLDAATCSQAMDNIAVLLNNGSGGFPSYVPAPEGPYNLNPRRVYAADFDNDEDMDLITPNSGNGTVTVYINNGSGGFPQGSWITTNVTYNPYDGYPADVNNDGNIDVVLACALEDKIVIIYGDGDGTFDPSMDVLSLPAGYIPLTSFFGDLDNNGYGDVVAVNYQINKVSVFLNEGEGVFNQRDDYAVGNGPLDIGVADLDGDGYPDLAIPNYSGNVTILVNDGSGHYGTPQTLTLGNSPTSIFAANLDDDGDIDLAVTAEGNDAVYIFLNNGDATFSSPTSEAVGDSPRGIFVGDLDNEGSPDLVNANQYSDDISVMLNFGPPHAPALVSPENGASFLLNTPIILDCSDVPGATLYYFEIDDDPNFGSPQHSGIAGVSQSQWEVSPPLSVGTYHWRVRGVNNCGFGALSAVRTLSVYKGGGTSCPVLYSYNGEEFVEENPLLTACELSGYTEVVTDHYMIKEPVAARGGRIVFQLREMENEITYLDDFELITADHDADSRIGCTVDGHIFTYVASNPPLSVVDQNGTDWTQAVQADDRVMFSGAGSGHLIVTFPNTGTISHLSFGSARKPPCPHEEPSGKQVAGEVPNALIVEQLGSDGDWIRLNDVPFRTNPSQEFIASDFLAPEESETITVRLSWNGEFTTDEIRQYIPADESAVVRTWRADDFAFTGENQAAKFRHGFDNMEPLVLVKGESVEFGFNVDELDDPSLKRDYIIRAVGRYQPDYSIYTKLAPNTFRLYSNYPNPFNPATRISYDIPKTSRVTLEVLNILGRHVATLVDESQQAGHYEVIWNGRDGYGNRVASGIYLYRLAADDFTESRKMILQK